MPRPYTRAAGAVHRHGKDDTAPLSQTLDRARAWVAIRRPDDDSILVLHGGTLPSFELERSSSWQVVAPVNEAMLERHGLTVTTLRAAWLSEALDERLYEVALTAGAIPPGSVRHNVADLGDALASLPPTVRSAIEAGALTPASGDLQPWYVPGWLSGMTAWIDERLSEAGLRRLEPIRQIRSWGRSALFRFQTDRGVVWAKEVPATFAHEIAVTGLLADVDPGFVPPLIAVDPTAGRLLMSHVAGPLLADVSEREAWVATMSRLAEIQRVLSAERDSLAVAGVAAAPLGTLAEATPRLLADRELGRVGLEGGSDEATAAWLAGHADDLAQACLDLAAEGIPDSLDHGDLSPSQVIVGEMGPVIFDWSDASITNPFLSLGSFLSGPPGIPTGSRPAILDAYLRLWRDAMGERDLERAVSLAEVVLPLHLARLYRDRILPGLEQPWEMDRVVPRLLTTLATRLQDRTDVR